MMSRMHVHVKEQARLLSTRPTLDELHGQRLYIHPDVRSADVCDRCALLHLTPSEDFSEKPNIYCTANTEDLRLRFAAMLTGGWIIDKAVLLGLPGTSVLYTATPTPRHIWVSEDFQLEDPEAWELMQSFLGRGKLWTLILNAEDFAAKKACDHSLLMKCPKYVSFETSVQATVQSQRIWELHQVHNSTCPTYIQC